MHEDYPRLEPLIASLLKLMTTYNSKPHPNLAKMISKQFEFITSHPEAKELTLLRNVSQRLHADWVSKGCCSMACEASDTIH
jgi:hypothetical protein